MKFLRRIDPKVGRRYRAIYTYRQDLPISNTLCEIKVLYSSSFFSDTKAFDCIIKGMSNKGMFTFFTKDFKDEIL